MGKNYAGAKRSNEMIRAEKKLRNENAFLLDLLVIMFVVMLAFCVSVVIREHVIIGTEVEGSSMQNTLFDGDNVYLLNTKKIQNGDIVRLDNPRPHVVDGRIDDKYLIKRIIASAGDSIMIPGDGYVYVNGEKLDESYIKEDGVTNYRDGDDNQFISEGVIPEGYIFVMGDNRKISMDSRTFGLISVNNVHGKALFLVRDGKIESV
jgi:signal peptidase I